MSSTGEKASTSQSALRFSPGFVVGDEPGAQVYAGVERDFEVRIQVFDWTADTFEEIDDATPEQAAAVRGRPTVSWINVDGIHDVGLIADLGARFGLHSMSLEDIVSTAHRPKVEHYPEYIYLVMRMARAGATNAAALEQVSLVLGRDFVLTFQVGPGDVFDAVRRRLRDSVGRIRSRGHDYLAYALMDAVVDNYVQIVEGVGARVEASEDALEEGTPEQIGALPRALHGEKRDLLVLRKALLPLREAVASLVRDANERVEPRNLPYFRDLHDHLVQLVDSIDIYREMIASLLGLHLSLVGQKTNEEMRVLTVIATIFIPLTFMVGVYGMNFESMPELHYPWAYPALWVAMVSVAGVLLVHFRRRRWI